MEDKVIIDCGTIAVTNLTPDELFIAIQPDEKSRREAIEFLKREKLNSIQKHS